MKSRSGQHKRICVPAELAFVLVQCCCDRPVPVQYGDLNVCIFFIVDGLAVGALGFNQEPLPSNSGSCAPSQADRAMTSSTKKQLYLEALRVQKGIS